MQRFILLEFTDERVRNFLTDLRAALEQRARPAPAHITLRGPYAEMPEQRLLEEMREHLQGYGVVIGGVGRFELANGFVVYLKAHSPVFEALWWKRDFPEAKHGRNPHVTVFETASASAADAVQSFLRSEKIELMTFSVSISVYTSKQLTLFEESLDAVAARRRRALERWRVRSGVIDRAARLGERLAAQLSG